MKIAVVSAAVLLLVAMPCHAVKVSPFTDTETFVKRAKNIVIAKCIGPVSEDAKHIDGIYAVDVDVIHVLKGVEKGDDKGVPKKLGKMRIATIYPMEAGKTYLLTSLGGSAEGADFLAIPELSVVQMPQNFRLGDLKNKTIVAQVQAVFDARYEEIARQQRLLEDEKKLLDKSGADKIFKPAAK